MQRIFEPFTRLAKKSADVSGSGLGLYITRGIAAAHVAHEKDVGDGEVENVWGAGSWQAGMFSG